MTEADKHFYKTCKEIIEHGYSSEGTGVRTDGKMEQKQTTIQL